MSIRSRFATKRLDNEKFANTVELVVDSLLPDGLTPPVLDEEQRWQEIQKKIKPNMSKEAYQQLLLDEYGPVQDRLHSWKPQTIEPTVTFVYSLDDNGDVRVDKE